jgi:uncharacterized protein
VTFVDSNIPMYLVGADHPHTLDVQRLLDHRIARGERLVTDAEVFQEILHRYSAIDRLDAIQPCFDALTAVVDEVFDVELPAVEEAKRILLGRYGVSARDALHIATMRANGVREIMSFDTGFDAYPGITRVS